jgi:hypothetical protein
MKIGLIDVDSHNFPNLALMKISAYHNLERINAISEIGFNPFVMLYRKEDLPPGHTLLRMQRWVNNKFIFNAVKDFYQYKE